MQPLDATVELRGMKRVGEPEETLAEVLDRGNGAVGFSRSQGTNGAETRVALPLIAFTRELRSQRKKKLEYHAVSQNDTTKP